MAASTFDAKALAPYVRQALLAKMTDETPETDRPTQARKPTVGKAAHLVHAAGNLADGLSTYRALSRGGEEMNPLLPNHGGAVLGIKAASILPEALLMRFLASKGHPKLAKALGYGLGAAGGLATIGNLRVKKGG